MGSDFFQNEADGLCINNKGGTLSDGNPQVMYACSTSNRDDGYVTTTWGGLLTDNGANGYALSSDGNNSSGAPLVEYTEQDVANQTFQSSLFPSLP